MYRIAIGIYFLTKMGVGTIESASSMPVRTEVVAMQAIGEYTKKVRGYLTDTRRISSARNDNVELGWLHCSGVSG